MATIGFFRTIVVVVVRSQKPRESESATAPVITVEVLEWQVPDGNDWDSLLAATSSNMALLYQVSGPFVCCLGNVTIVEGRRGPMANI